MSIRSRAKWTKEDILIEARRFASKKEWEKTSGSSYNAARNGGYMQEASSHMKRPTIHNKKWTKDKVAEEALKYLSKVQWQKESSGSFLAAYRNSWIQEVSSHMKSFRGCCDSEKQILDLVRSHYPKAKTTRFKNNDKNFSFKRMEIDVFIPEINKGIEFDGEYWHRPEVLRVNRPSWTESEIQNYSKIKDLFFKSKGIEIMHVSETIWNSSKEYCIKAILMFIGVSG
jgi:hypothetical protein